MYYHQSSFQKGDNKAENTAILKFSIYLNYPLDETHFCALNNLALPSRIPQFHLFLSRQP